MIPLKTCSPADSASTFTGKPQGIERVWAAPRSTFYQRREQNSQSGFQPRKRGPPTILRDDQLLALVRADLARSPFSGEGH